MNLNQHDLRQMDEDYLRKCEEKGCLLEVSQKLLQDVKELTDRLNQNPSNSSRPSGSQAPWEEVSNGQAGEDDKSAETDSTPELDNTENQKNKKTSDTSKDETPTDTSSKKQGTRSPGRQLGAEGHGRTQKFEITGRKEHRSAECACCKAPSAEGVSRPYTAWNELELAEPIEGKCELKIECIQHVMYDTECNNCGHITRATHYQSPPDILWEKIELGQWRLIGPRLAAMIVFLSIRMRLSRERIREFLYDFFGLQLSKGLIDHTIREAGRACDSLEPELVKAVVESALANADETPWKESGKLLWLWVFVTQYTVLYCIGYRTAEILKNVLEGFDHIFMSDGYIVYRDLMNRLRCWAHLVRKMRGLAESTDSNVARVGQRMLDIFCELMEGIYRARDQAHDPTSIPSLASQYTKIIEELKTLCDLHRGSTHKKLRELAREILLDWEVIFRQVDEPHLPLTNNDAERALRHWVIFRRLSQGTRSESGSRAFALLASVIDTCRRRKASIRDYLANVIASARTGLSIPQLPPIPV
jgi:hypothetical protein